MGDHLGATGEVGGPVLVETRLLCYEIHIGLAAQAYNAFRGRWALVAANARQTTALVESA